MFWFLQRHKALIITYLANKTLVVFQIIDYNSDTKPKRTIVTYNLI